MRWSRLAGVLPGLLSIALVSLAESVNGVSPCFGMKKVVRCTYAVVTQPNQLYGLADGDAFEAVVDEFDRLDIDG